MLIAQFSQPRGGRQHPIPGHVGGADCSGPGHGPRGQSAGRGGSVADRAGTWGFTRLGRVRAAHWGATYGS